MPSRSIRPTFAAPQLARLQKFRATRSVDIHCHILPGIDDGPANLAEAVAMCRLMMRDGFTDLIATPHQLGRYDGVNWSAEIRRGVKELQAALDREGIPLTIHAGAEVRIDERIPKLMELDQVMTLADGGDFLLLELPTQASVSPQAVANVLGDSAVNVILAHAERYDSLRRDPASAQGWLDAGAYLQVNATSLVEDHPPGSYSAAMQWIEAGWVSLLASDAHNLTTRRPRMTEAIEAIERQFSTDIARELCIVNPVRILEGER